MLPVQENPGRQNDSIYRSPDQSALNPITDPFNLDDTPFIDGHDFEDANFDWDDTEEQLFGDLPGESALGNGIHDKRKNNDDDENEDGKNKRHEGNEKNSKKPGRKPLNSSEPTTVSLVPDLPPLLVAHFSFRNAKHKIAPLRERSVSVRKDI